MVEAKEASLRIVRAARGTTVVWVAGKERKVVQESGVSRGHRALRWRGRRAWDDHGWPEWRQPCARGTSWWRHHRRWTPSPRCACPSAPAHPSSPLHTSSLPPPTPPERARTAPPLCSAVWLLGMNALHRGSAAEEGQPGKSSGSKELGHGR